MKGKLRADWLSTLDELKLRATLRLARGGWGTWSAASAGQTLLCREVYALRELQTGAWINWERWS